MRHIRRGVMRIATVIAIGMIGAYQVQAWSFYPLLTARQVVPGAPFAPAPAPAVRSVDPEIVGIGGKIRLRGVNLGTAQNAVVVFHPGVVAEVVERHTPNEIVVRVPIGAQTGPIQVVTGVNAPALRTLQTQIGVIEGSESPVVQAEIAQMKTQQGFMLSFGRFSNPVKRMIILPYMDPKPTIPPVIEESGGLKIIRNRLIVDLKDFLSFDVALEIADRIGAELVGHFPITNSYVLDLRRAPRDLQALEAIMAQVGRDPRVAEVWQDFLLELKQVRFADVDVVDRYRHHYNANLHGREDVWATDRIQAPGAWNLIERFITEDTNGNGQLDQGEDRNNNGRIDTGRAALYDVKVAVMDTGCDHQHREFDTNRDGDVADPEDVPLKKVEIRKVSVRIAGREEILPLPAAFAEAPYDLGDPIPIQHGTRVTSLIGARNGNVLDAAQGDRGINGLLHNPMPYTIQVYRGSDWSEGGDWTTLTEFLSVINVAALTGASVMNASWGQPHPVNPDGSAYDVRHPGTLRAIRVALRKLAHQLNQFRERLLLVVAAGNEAEPNGRDENPHDGLDDRDPDGIRGLVTPFEDINLNGRLDAGEDLDGDGTLDHGNYVAASLGTLPNVITVGAIGGPDYGVRGWARDDQRANFSNWGIPVQIAAPGTDVFTAGGRPDTFTIGGARFSRSDGTSFATPLVTGSAALLKAIAPPLTPRQIKAYLLDTSFEVNTTNGVGDLMVWRTLKTGYAVRKLMVDRGIIRDDQIWTGVSKVIYNGLRMFEIRRGPDGRAEAFADRELPGLTGTMPSLAHHGRVVIWIADARTIKEHAFTTDTTGDFVVLNPGFQLEPLLEAAPDLNYLFGVRTIDGDCNRRVEVYAARTRVADTGVFNICAFGFFGARDWQYYFLHRAAWRPDSRKWALDYFHANGRGNTTNQSCRSLWDNNPFPPAAALPFPGCTGVEFRYPAWSPDGRAYAGGSSAEHLDIVYYDSLRDERRTHRGGIADTPLLWINWSPDGSELGYTGANGITTVRRDFRTPADRAPRLLQSRIGGVFTWQW